MIMIDGDNGDDNDDDDDDDDDDNRVAVHLHWLLIFIWLVIGESCE